MLTNIAIVVLAVVCLTVGVALAWYVSRILMRGRAEQFDALSDRGQLYWSDVSFRISLVMFWLSGALLGMSMIPAVVWIWVPDVSAGQAAFRLVATSLVIVVIAVLAGLPGWRVYILQNDRLVQRRFGREQVVLYDQITRIVELHPVPRIRIKTDGRRSIRVFKTIDNYEDFFNRLCRYAPQAEIVQESPLSRRRPVSRPSDVPSSYVVPKRVRIATVAGSVFRQDQPVELHLGDLIHYRLPRGEIIERHPTEVFSVGVETETMTSKARSGYRHPLYLRFVDGSHLKIGDARARHMQSTTHAIGSDIRDRFMSIGDRMSDDRARSQMLVSQAQTHVARGDAVGAIPLFKNAVALFPDIERLQLYRRIGDLHRSLDENADAVAAYRAHVDRFPGDADAWLGLASSLDAMARTHLAAEAKRAAEQLAAPAHHTQRRAA
ncbi:MAG: hypothetical protein EX269_01555 [Acidimicrobiales bacterium]|nr:MAG: hypothetical protein EX269_01555 [Acidimicrobiales bacterium]